MLTDTLSFTRRSLVITPSVGVRPGRAYDRRRLVCFIYSTFCGVSGDHDGVIDFLVGVFPLCFPTRRDMLTGEYQS